MKKWILLALPAAVFALLGILLSQWADTSFLGFVSMCLALVSACAGGLVWLHGRKPRLTRLLAGALAVLLLIGLGMVTVVGILVADHARGDAPRECDYILVLGAWTEGDALASRIEEAYAYLSSYPDTIAVLTGGQGSDEKMSEAKFMYQSLVSMGIAPSRLWLEERATSTWENFRFSLELIRERTGVTPRIVGVITSDYHLYRASLFGKAHGLQTVGIPANTEDPINFMNDYLREIAGVWHYFILGGLYHDGNEVR